MTPAKCDQCRRPLIEIDNYGERLEGWVACNAWRAAGERQWRELPEPDIEALRATLRRAVVQA